MKIKVVCLNVWIGGILFAELLDFLRTENADILLLQEVRSNSGKNLPREYQTHQVLQKELGYEYASFAPAFIDSINSQEVVQGNLVLSKYPLREIKTIFYDIPFGIRIDEPEYYAVTPRNLQHVLVEIGDKSIHLFNTQGIWGTNGLDTERRIAMGKIIAHEVSQVSPVLLAGDFNILPESETISLIEKQLVSVFKDELTTSFNVTRKNLLLSPGYANSVVDMFFVSKELIVQNHYCPQVDISDHLPLVVELSL